MIERGITYQQLLFLVWLLFAVLGFLVPWFGWYKDQIADLKYEIKKAREFYNANDNVKGFQDKVYRYLFAGTKSRYDNVKIKEVNECIEDADGNYDKFRKCLRHVEHENKYYWMNDVDLWIFL